MFTSKPPTCAGRTLALPRKDRDIRYLRPLGNSDIAVFRRCVVSDESPRLPPPPGYIDRDPYLAAWTCTGEVQEWGNAYIRAVGREGLEPGASTRQFTLQSGLGYTGEQARLEMLQHRDFVDAKVELFVKQGAGQWVKLGEHQIEKQLLTR